MRVRYLAVVPIRSSVPLQDQPPEQPSEGSGTHQLCRDVSAKAFAPLEGTQPLPAYKGEWQAEISLGRVC